MKSMTPRHALVAAVLGLLSAASIVAQDEPPSMEEIYAALNITPQTEGTALLGSRAEIDVPEGYQALDPAETARLMKEWGNLPSRYDGLVGPEGLDWFVVFEYEDSGHVPDDDKADLDADKMMKMMKEGESASNEARKAAGLPANFLEGWVVEPKYNEETNNLEWGFRFRDDTGFKTVNYRTKLLGRTGVMDCTLVCDPGDLESTLPTYQQVLAGYRYRPGHTYAEYRKGDKLAKYGLTALVVGGGAALAAKTGFLAKFWKILIIPFILVGAFFKNLFSRNK